MHREVFISDTVPLQLMQHWHSNTRFKTCQANNITFLKRNQTEQNLFKYVLCQSLRKAQEAKDISHCTLNAALSRGTCSSSTS